MLARVASRLCQRVAVSAPTLRFASRGPPRQRNVPAADGEGAYENIPSTKQELIAELRAEGSTVPQNKVGLGIRQFSSCCYSDCQRSV